MNILYRLSEQKIRHLDSGNGQPLCDPTRSYPWKSREGNPTCWRCLQRMENRKEAVQETISAFKRVQKEIEKRGEV